MLHMRISKRSHIRNYNEKEKIVNIGYTWVATDGITYKKKNDKYMASIWDRAYGCDDGSSVAQYLKTYNVIFDSRMLYANKGKFLRIYYIDLVMAALLIYFVLYTLTAINPRTVSLQRRMLFSGSLVHVLSASRFILYKTKVLCFKINFLL